MKGEEKMRKKVYKLICHNVRTKTDRAIAITTHDISNLVKFLAERGIMVIDAKETGEEAK